MEHPGEVHTHRTTPHRTTVHRTFDTGLLQTPDFYLVSTSAHHFRVGGPQGIGASTLKPSNLLCRTSRFLNAGLPGSTKPDFRVLVGQTSGFRYAGLPGPAMPDFRVPLCRTSGSRYAGLPPWMESKHGPLEPLDRTGRPLLVVT